MNAEQKKRQSFSLPFQAKGFPMNVGIAQ